MEKLKENVDYSTEGLVKAINHLMLKVDKLSELTLMIASRNQSEFLESEAVKVMKM